MAWRYLLASPPRVVVVALAVVFAAGKDQASQQANDATWLIQGSASISVDVDSHHHAASSLTSAVQESALKSVGDSVLPVALDEQDGSQGIEHQQHLRICSAYTSDAALDVVHRRTKQVLMALTYKQCADASLSLTSGDEIDFLRPSADTAEAAGQDVLGTFAVAKVPPSTATLLLVAHRQQGGDGATFASHAFAPSEDDAAQVAIIDAFEGEANESRIRISEARHGSDGEAVPLNAVVGVNPGSYKVSIDSSVVPLTVRSAANYVVLRTGEAPTEDKDDKFPEELLVIAMSDSGACQKGYGLWWLSLLSAVALALRS